MRALVDSQNFVTDIAPYTEHREGYTLIDFPGFPEGYMLGDVLKWDPVTETIVLEKTL